MGIHRRQRSRNRRRESNETQRPRHQPGRNSRRRMRRGTPPPPLHPLDPPGRPGRAERPTEIRRRAPRSQRTEAAGHPSRGGREDPEGPPERRAARLRAQARREPRHQHLAGPRGFRGAQHPRGQPQEPAAAAGAEAAEGVERHQHQHVEHGHRDGGTEPAEGEVPVARGHEPGGVVRRGRVRAAEKGGQGLGVFDPRLSGSVGSGQDCNCDQELGAERGCRERREDNPGGPADFRGREGYTERHAGPSRSGTQRDAPGRGQIGYLETRA